MKEDDHPDHNMPDPEHDGMEILKSDMNYDKNLPWQRSMRGLAEGATIKASKVFRKNDDQ